MSDQTCGICHDTGLLDDAQAWDAGQRPGECPYCPERVRETLTRLAAAERALEAADRVIEEMADHGHTCPLCAPDLERYHSRRREVGS